MGRSPLVGDRLHPLAARLMTESSSLMTASCRELQSAEDRVLQMEDRVLKSESCRLCDLQGVRLATMESERPVSGQVTARSAEEDVSLGEPSGAVTGVWFG